eukprot:scaffold999_cov375-Prasinococcus_capsulatus_cf.AAC.5
MPAGTGAGSALMAATADWPSHVTNAALSHPLQHIQLLVQPPRPSHSRLRVDAGHHLLHHHHPIFAWMPGPLASSRPSRETPS